MVVVQASHLHEYSLQELHLTRIGLHALEVETILPGTAIL
jgi:hypothetical protein